MNRIINELLKLVDEYNLPMDILSRETKCHAEDVERETAFEEYLATGDILPYVDELRDRAITAILALMALHRNPELEILNKIEEVFERYDRQRKD